MADKNGNINNNKKHYKNVSDFCGDKNGFLSLSEAAEYTPYSQEYLSLRARQGKLKSAKIGRDWMTTINWVENYLREHNGGNGDIKENKKFLENLTKSYGAVLKYGAVTAVLFLIIYFGLSSQNFKSSVGKVFSSTGEKYLEVKDWAKFSWAKQQIKTGQIFVSVKDQSNNFLKNLKDKSSNLSQVFAADYKNKIKKFDNGLIVAKNFTMQGVKNLKTKTSDTVSQSKIIAKNFVSHGKFVSAVFSDKTKDMGNFITGSLKPVKNLPKVLSGGKNLIKEKSLALSRETSDFFKFTANKSSAFASGVKNKINDVYAGGRKNINGLIQQFALLGIKTKSLTFQTFNDLNSTAKQFALASLGAIKNSANSVPVILKHNSQSISQKTRGLFNDTKSFIAKNVLTSKAFALYTFKKSQSFVGEKLFALRIFSKKNLSNGQNIINSKMFAFKDSISKALFSFNGYFDKNIVNIQKGVIDGSIAFGNSIKNNINNIQGSIAKSFAITKGSTINGINLVSNSLSVSFIVARNSVASAISSTRNFVRQTSRKAVFKTGQSLVAANNKIVERPAEILSGSISSGIKVATVKADYNLKLARKNIQDFNKDLIISLKQASKNMTIPYFASIEGAKKMKEGTILLADKTKQLVIKAANNSKNFVGEQIFAFKTSVNNSWLALNNSAKSGVNSTKQFAVNSWGNFSDKLSNGYLALLNYLIPERSLTPTPSVSQERIVKTPNTGVVVLPAAGGAGISQNKYLLSKIEESFSDEVKVEPSKDGNAGIIKPTQPAVPGEEYLYMIVPVKPEVKK